MAKFDFVGAGWTKISKSSGNKYLSLSIGKAAFAVFKAKEKKKATSPDYSVVALDDLGKEMARFGELRKEGTLPPLSDILAKFGSSYGNSQADDDLPF